MKRWSATDSLFWFIFVGFAVAGFVALAAISALAIFGSAVQQRKVVTTTETIPILDQELPGKDIAPFDDTDVRLSKVVILDSDNAYFDLVKLKDVVDEPKDTAQTILDMVAGKTWDAKFAEEIISRNAQAFAIFSVAAQKPRFQDPATADPENITPNMAIPPISSWREMARLSAVRALFLAQQGRDKEAIEEALNPVRIGQKIQESQPVTVEYLLAMGMKNVGLETVQKILVSSNLASNYLLPYAQSFNQYYNNEDGLIAVYKGIYHSTSWSIDDIVHEVASQRKEALSFFVGKEASGNLANRFWTKRDYYFQPNKTKLLFAEYTRAMMEDAWKPCGDMQATERLKPTLLTPEESVFTENAIGKHVYGLGIIGLGAVPDYKCKDDLLVAATQALIAIKAYKTDINNYPLSLNELVPRYLSTIPLDPYDGKTLKYSAEKKIIYSVGRDLIDAGGSTGDSWQNMPDPTFTINF